MRNEKKEYYHNVVGPRDLSNPAMAPSTRVRDTATYARLLSNTRFILFFILVKFASKSSLKVFTAQRQLVVPRAVRYTTPRASRSQ